MNFLLWNEVELGNDKNSFIPPSFFELWMEQNVKLWDQCSFEHLILIMYTFVAGDIEMRRYPAVTRNVFSRV